MTCFSRGLAVLVRCFGLAIWGAISVAAGLLPAQDALARFRDASDAGSIYDELLVVRPPKRLVGGVLVRF